MPLECYQNAISKAWMFVSPPSVIPALSRTRFVVSLVLSCFSVDSQRTTTIHLSTTIKLKLTQKQKLCNIPSKLLRTLFTTDHTRYSVRKNWVSRPDKGQMLMLSESWPPKAIRYRAEQRPQRTAGAEIKGNIKRVWWNILINQHVHWSIQFTR